MSEHLSSDTFSKFLSVITGYREEMPSLPSSPFSLLRQKEI